ncbi:MAG: hypothetical protein KJI71_04795 [Patescibacteria group bacterium]|nr:hypothetical protein [Patescibacteria group bacterium]
MSKISVKRRRFEIKKKRKRKEKIKKLREKYSDTKNKREKKEVLDKIQKIAPHYPIEEILKLEKDKS